MSEYLRLENITKKYGDFYANKDINLVVNKKTIHAIIGENGAGKSTLMNEISGVVKPTSGKIFLNNKEIRLNNPNDATKNNIGMVQQEFMLFNELTVLENIIMGMEDVGKLGFLNLKESRRKISKICEEYNFELPLDRLVSSLPIAIQQQVEIVKVLYKDADIIIFDEPTAVLTPQGIEGFFRAMENLVENGKTILFITHKLKEVMKISDEITILKSGEKVKTLETKNTNEKELASLMVGREVFLNVERKRVDKSETLLEVDNLCVNNDKGIQKVDNLSLKLRKGEILGIAGIAENGQTELIESIFGIRKAKSGFIKYKGENITNLSPKKLRLKKIGYVPEDRIGTGSSIHSNLVENTIMGKHLTEFSKNGLLKYSKASNFTKEVVNFYKVKTDSINNNADSLSGGNLQKLIVGREFSQNNELLVIEDPTRGIDIGSMEFIWGEIIHQVEDLGYSCLLVSYDLNEVMSLSDRILVIYRGHIVREFQRKDFDEKQIGLYMLGGNRNENETYA